MEAAEVETRLASWLATQLPDANDVRVSGLDRVEVGHSAETLLLTASWRSAGADRREEVVLRLRPPEPGLLPPYDLARQFHILRALEPTAVRAPRALWYEGSGDVLGREFYVMERLPGAVHERGVPDEVAADPDRIRRMCTSMVDQLAAIHTVDLHATGLDTIGDGHGYVERELDHWASEVRRVQKGRLPALERLLELLRDQQPEPCPAITLVHGDAKPGNYAFVGDEVSAVFDWEMAAVGDPLADLGWMEVLWTTPGSITTVPGAPSADEFVARWERYTGIPARHRSWYRAFQLYKMGVIMLVGGRLFDDGHSDDLRLADMAYAVPFMTQPALRELGVDDELEPGPLFPDADRVKELRRRAQR